MIKLIERSRYIHLEGDQEQLKWLRSKLRYRPKNYWRSDAYRCYRQTDGKKGWDGYRYPLRYYANQGWAVLRGRKDDILELCAEEGIRVDRDGLFKSPFAEWTLDDIPDDLIQADFALDDHQKEAVLQWLQNCFGIANMAVNAGKTATFAAAASLIKRNYGKARFLYFTFSERLVRQVYAAMREFLPGWEITQYGGGKKDKTGQDMVVATQAMLNKHFPELQQEGWFDSFTGLLLDESHHTQSETAQKIILASKALFRLGASDSTKEADPDKWNAIRGLCGPVRCGVSSSWLIDEGRSAAPVVYIVDVPEWNNLYEGAPHTAEPNSPARWFRHGQWVDGVYRGPVLKRDDEGKTVWRKRRIWDDEEETWKTETVAETEPSLHRVEFDGRIWRADARYVLLDRRYDEAIIRFDRRNQMIADWVRFYSGKGWPTLVVATRTPHVLLLEEMLREVVGSKVTLLFGEDTSAHRDKVFDWFKRTPGSVLVTPLVKEGVSINEIKAGVIADPIADIEVARQIIGRFMRRKKDENVCHITWFLDRQHPRFRRNATEIIGSLEKLKGFTFYYPCAGPETIGQALIHRGGSPGQSATPGRTRILKRS